jgi:hypothetical protein
VRLKNNLDMAMAALFSLLLIPAVVFTTSLVARLTLGVPFLLFVPRLRPGRGLFPRQSAPQRR